MAATDGLEATGEAALRDGLRRAVREWPLATALAAGVVGAALGGVVFTRMGRLVFLATVGYAAGEVWRREGRLDIANWIRDWSEHGEDTP